MHTKNRTLHAKRNWMAVLFLSILVSMLAAGCGGKATATPAAVNPNDPPVTRAQAAIVILLGMHGNSYLPPAATGTAFSDVPADLFGAAWIEEFVREGITAGCGEGKYCPEKNVTRAQIAIFLLKAKYGAAYVPPVAAGKFSDVPAGTFGADWIEQFVNEGIAAECSPGMYCPNALVTSSEMGVLLKKAFNLP